MAVVNSGATDGAATFDATSERYLILGENIQAVENLVGDNGLTGYLDPMGNRLRSAVRYVAGTFLMEMGPYELAAWLPRILRNAAVGTTYDVGESPLPFDILVERDQGVARYNSLQVDRVLLRAASSVNGGDEQILQAQITVLGQSENANATWPAVEPTLTDANRPFWLLGDTTMSLGSGLDEVEYPTDAFNLLIDNNLIPLARNNLTLTCIRSAGRDVRLQFPTPLTVDSYADLYQSRFDGVGTLKFDAAKNLTPAVYATTFSFPRLIQKRITPATRGRAEIPLSIDLKAYRTNAAGSVSVVNTLPA